MAYQRVLERISVALVWATLVLVVAGCAAQRPTIAGRAASTTSGATSAESRTAVGPTVGKATGSTVNPANRLKVPGKPTDPVTDSGASSVTPAEEAEIEKKCELHSDPPVFDITCQQLRELVPSPCLSTSVLCIVWGRSAAEPTIGVLQVLDPRSATPPCSDLLCHGIKVSAAMLGQLQLPSSGLPVSSPSLSADGSPAELSSTEPSATVTSTTTTATTTPATNQPTTTTTSSVVDQGVPSS